MTSACAKDIPRYLWRVYADDANGFNDPTIFASAAAVSDIAHAGMIEIPLKSLKGMLTGHLEWKRDVLNNEFISFTSSLLYALQFAVCKTRKKNDASFRRDESKVKICLVDANATETELYPSLALIEIYALNRGGSFNLE